jgi:hypothetical protein
MKYFIPNVGYRNIVKNYPFYPFFIIKFEGPISVSPFNFADQYIVQKIYLVLSVTSALSWLKQCICLGATHAMIFLVQTRP